MKYIAIIALILSFGACSTSKTVKKEPLAVYPDSPKIQAGTVEAQFDKIISIAGIKQGEITVNYYPLEDIVCLQYRIDFITYQQFWGEEGRSAYKSALEQYKKDFEQKSLNARGSRKTIRKYGKVECYLIWQAAAFTVKAKANTYIDLGYDIKEVSKTKASFFTLFQRGTDFIDEMKKTEIRSSVDIPIYLTRSQADELAGLFDQDFLKSIVPAGINKKNEEIIFDTL